MGTIMNRKFLGLMATAFALCSTVSCSGDKSAAGITGVAGTDSTGIGLNDSTAGEARTPGPSAVTDLQVSGTDTTSVTLSFTQVNDGTGQPAKYDVRYAVAPISWSSAPSVASGTCKTPVAGTAAGSQFTCTVLGLAPATSYNFQLVAFRGTMNQNAVYGSLSNIAAATTASSTAPGPAPVASVTVTPTSATLAIGATVQLQVSAFDANNNPLTGRVVTSSSANAGIASVNSAGLVTAVSAGTTQITVTSEGKSAVASITVSAPPPPPAAGSPSAVTNLQASVTGTTSVTLSFTQVDDGTGQPAKYNVRYAVAPISWGAATSTTSGTCSTPVAGTATGAQLSCTVLGLTPATNYNFQLVAFRGTMNQDAVYGALSNIAAATTTSSAPAPVASVTVTPTSATLAIGSTVQLQVSAFDANNNPLTGRVVTSSSANAGIASVNSAGLVTAVSAGTTQITVTSEGKSATATITVATAAPAPVATVTVSPASSSVETGATAQFSAVTRDASDNTLTGRSITWSSSNTSVATISSAGLVTAVAAGSATITASSEGKTGTATLTVTAAPPVPVASVTVTPTTASLLIGATVQLMVTARDANNNVLTGRTVTSQSANAGIASVTSLGVVKGVSAGTTQITVTVEGKSAVATVTVTAPAPAPVATVTVSPASATLQVGATSQLSATLRDANNNVLTGRTIVWSTGNAGIASVNASGLVTASGAGSTQIAATSEGKTGTATITVTAAPPPPPPPPGGSNEPAGLSLISDRPFNSTTPTYTQGEAGWWDSDNGALAIIQDATAPRSPNNVARMAFNAGIAGGFAPSTLERPVSATTIYVATWIKFSPNWQSHNSGVNKILHLWIGGGNHVVITAAGRSFTGSSPLTARISLQGISGGGNNPDGSGTYESSAQFVRGQWHKIEVVGVANSAGANNGSLKLYIDGVLATQCSGINFGGTSWTSVTWAPVWGGTGDQIAATQYEYLDHIYLSGK
jgi:uncharacterized protein YjdB